MNVSINLKIEERNGIKIIEKRNRFQLDNYRPEVFSYSVLLSNSIEKQTNNKKLYHYFELYENSSYKCLSDCYRKFSYKKYRYFKECLRVCKILDGVSPKILTFNQNVFTFGFMFEFNDSKYFVLITPTRCECMNALDLIIDYRKYN